MRGFEAPRKGAGRLARQERSGGRDRRTVGSQQLSAAPKG